MSKTPKQIDLEQAIAARNGIPAELIDPFTGAIFKPKAHNHYEDNDGVPVAPTLTLNRPTIRQRIENLLNRDPDVIRRYMQQGPADGQEGIDMEVPDDPEAPLTASESNYLDTIAGDLAEQAPLPDDGLPRPQPAPPVSQPQAGDTPGGGGAPATSAPPKGASDAPSGVAPVPTR